VGAGGDRRRLLALGGIVGPTAFVVAWAACGRATAGYSAVTDAISDLARVGAPTRPAMTLGFVVFGVGVPLFGVALRAALPGRAWMAAVVCGMATLGVAAVPLGRGSDGLHGLFAGVGYVALAATPALAWSPLRRAGCPVGAGASLVVAAVAGGCLALTVAGPAHGLFQRAGLTVGDAWLVASGVVVLVGTRVAGTSDRRDGG
jgi:hypothetical protein